MEKRDTLEVELLAANVLARLSAEDALVEADRNFDFLNGLGSVVMMLELADRLRSYLAERFPSGPPWSVQQVATASAEMSR